MAKDLSISILLDFYGDMLTRKTAGGHRALLQRRPLPGGDFRPFGHHPAGVRDSIKRAEAQLLEYEGAPRLGQTVPGD